ncbi:unnamed protein product, partial [Brassica napus]
MCGLLLFILVCFFNSYMIASLLVASGGEWFDLFMIHVFSLLERPLVPHLSSNSCSTLVSVSSRMCCKEFEISYK